MGDREDKLTKAREKLEKFRKKKQKLNDPFKVPESVQLTASSASSPLIFQVACNPEPFPLTPVVDAVAEPPVPVQDVHVPNIEAEPSSPPAASLSSYFGVPSQDNITAFEEISSAVPDVSNSILIVPQNNGIDFHTDSVSDVSVEQFCTEVESIVAGSSDDVQPCHALLVTEETTTEQLPSVSSSYFESTNAAQTLTSADSGHGFPQISSLTVQLQSATLESSSPPVPAITASSSQNSAFVQSTLSYESSNVEVNHETVLEKLCIEDPVMVDDLNMLPSSTTAEQRTDIPPLSTLPDLAASALSTVSLDSADKLTEVQDQVEVRLVPDTAMDSRVETLEQLTSHSQDLFQEERTNNDSDVGSEINSSSQVLELQSRNQNLVNNLETAILEKNNCLEELALVKKQVVELLSSTQEENTAEEARLVEENSKLKSDLLAQTQTIEMLVSQKSELEASSRNLKEESESLLRQKLSLESSVDELRSECLDLRGQVTSDEADSEKLRTLTSQTEKEICSLKDTLSEKEESYLELQSKLIKVTDENSVLLTQLATVTSELEMCKVHLTQLRGSGAQNILNEKDAEIAALNGELGITRKNLSEALGRVEHLVGEREQLAEQYRSYSRDLATQAERLSEQLRKFQDENARLLHREAGLVQTVGSLESQINVFRKEGKNVTEEEICRLKDHIVSSESELRMITDEKVRMQEMLVERGNQVDEMGQRLAMRETKILELQGKVSGLETTVEMLKTTSHSSDSDQAELLAACQSDKVAASRAMQQNINLKARLEELHGAMVTLTNTKAELLDKLDTANKTISSYDNIQAEIAARDEAVKEKEIMLTNMRNQVRYLEEELSRQRTPDSNQIENSNTASLNKIEENQQIIDMEKELYQAREMIRNLNSQNSELRSKLEVLSSNTRDCSESRCDSSSDGRVEMVESSLSDSSDSFVELNVKEKSNVSSSDSFVNVDPAQNDEYEASETDVTSVEQTVIRTVDLPFAPSQELSSSQTNSSLDNFESMKQLENRFMAAMEQLAKLSSDKEQLEHLVERLQEETETIGDYVIMYQHQRKMQKIKIQEKEEQVIQLAKDRAELLTKLTQLQKLVTNLVDDPSEDVSISTQETLVEEVGTKSPEKVSEKMASSMEKEKILELISEIGTDSGQIMARCENFEPWFWENSPSKVMTV